MVVFDEWNMTYQERFNDFDCIQSSPYWHDMYDNILNIEWVIIPWNVWKHNEESIDFFVCTLLIS